MLAEGESGRYEFKRDADAVSVSVLAALANWAALDPAREVAHLLVGVDDVADEKTGLVHGEPCGLSKGLDRSVARLQDMASKTRPIPVDAFIIEEAVAEARPFIRVEIRPTMPPHFDERGSRQTRQGRSTRALTDEELLGVYLDREAGRFAARFRQAGDELRSAVGAVGTQVDQIADAIQQQIAEPLEELVDAAEMAASAASSAESAASDVGYDLRRVEQMVRDLRSTADDLQDATPEVLAARVAQSRQTVWVAFTEDTWTRSSAHADRLARRLHTVLSAEISLDMSKNTWELRVWGDVLRDRQELAKKHGTLKWWEQQLGDVIEFLRAPIYQAPELSDLRAELRSRGVAQVLQDPKSLTRMFYDQLDS